VGSILLSQGNYATPVAWSRLLFPSPAASINTTASSAGNNNNNNNNNNSVMGITCDEGLALALLMPSSATKHELLTVSLLKKNKQIMSCGSSGSSTQVVVSQSQRTVLSQSAFTKIDEQRVMTQDADACTLELITQLTTMLVSTSGIEKTRGRGTSGAEVVGLRSERPNGSTKETPKSKVNKEIGGTGKTPKGGSGKGMKTTTPKGGGKQDHGVVTLPTVGKCDGDIDSSGSSGHGGGGVQIPLSCGWRPVSDNDRNQSKELIHQVNGNN